MKLVAWSLIAGKTTLSAFLVSLAALLLAPDPAAAQGFGGRTATVSVAEAQEDVLSIFVEVQGRVAAGQVTAVTASINAVTTLEDLRIGDLVKAGQVIAQQNSGDLQNRLDILSSQRREAGLRVDEIEQATESDLTILELQNVQLELLAGKADRARELVARNALAVDAAETAAGAVLKIQEEIAKREATLARAAGISFVRPKRVSTGLICKSASSHRKLPAQRSPHRLTVRSFTCIRRAEPIFVKVMFWSGREPLRIMKLKLKFHWNICHLYERSKPLSQLIFRVGSCRFRPV